MASRILLIISIAIWFATNPVQAGEDPGLDTLYKVTMLRAGPGQLEDLIDFLKDQKEAGYFAANGEEPPMIMRHSQGDHWDLFLLQDIGDYQTYYGPELLDLRQTRAGAISEFQTRLNDLAVFREEMTAWGPDSATVKDEFRNNGFFHLELFAALAGKHEELLDQRIRENGYLEAIGLRANLVFVTDFGPDIDVFTIGFYQNLQDFAAALPADEDKKLQAAIDNGFKSQNHIGFNLREFLAYHHDTLATKVE